MFFCYKKKHTQESTPKITWNFLKQFHIMNPPSITLNRKSIVDRNYKLLKLYLKNNNININNFITNKFFGYKNKFKEYRFIKNEFPYYVENHINHHILWINPNIANIFDNTKIIDLVNKILNNKEYIIFKNQNNNLSVSQIIHYHIFFKNE